MKLENQHTYDFKKMKKKYFFSLMLNAIKKFFFKKELEKPEIKPQMTSEEYIKQDVVLSEIKKNYSIENILNIKNRGYDIEQRHLYFIMENTPTKSFDLLKNGLIDFEKHRHFLFDKILDTNSLSIMNEKQRAEFKKDLKSIELDKLMSAINEQIDHVINTAHKTYKVPECRNLIGLAKILQSMDSELFISNERLINLRKFVKPYYKNIIDEMYQKNLDIKNYEQNNLEIKKRDDIIQVYSKEMKTGFISNESLHLIHECEQMSQILLKNNTIKIENMFYIEKTLPETMFSILDNFHKIQAEDIEKKSIYLNGSYLSPKEVLHINLLRIKNILDIIQEEIDEKKSKNNLQALAVDSIYLQGLEKRIKP